MAGTPPAGWDATAFRDAIHFAMIMGQPNAPGQPVTFRWTPEPTYASATDSAGRPYDWTSTPTTPGTKPDVVVPVAVKFAGGGSGDETDMGTMDSTRATLTLLDEDYALVTTADLVLIAGQTYTRVGVAIPEGLFDVTVWTIQVEATS